MRRDQLGLVAAGRGRVVPIFKLASLRELTPLISKDAPEASLQSLMTMLP